MGGVGLNGVQMPLSLAHRRSAITHTSLPVLLVMLVQELMQVSAVVSDADASQCIALHCHLSMIAHILVDGIGSDMLVHANPCVPCAAYS